MWWWIGTILTVAGVAGALVLGNKRRQRRALRGLTRRVSKRVAAPPKTRNQTPAFTAAPDPRVVQVCTARGCYTSKSPKKDCRCPCKGKLHGTGRPSAKSSGATRGPVSTRPAPGRAGTAAATSRVETALQAHARSSPGCNGGTVSRRTFGDGRVTYTCNTCKVVLAS